MLRTVLRISEEENAAAIAGKTLRPSSFLRFSFTAGMFQFQRSLINILWPELEPEKFANFSRHLHLSANGLAENGFSEYCSASWTDTGLTPT
jgi:hypothetical protein